MSPDYPGIPSRHQREPTIKSLIPAALTEASGARVSVSLLLIAAIGAGTYWAGLQAGQGATREQVLAITEKQSARDEKIVKLVESIDGSLKNQTDILLRLDARQSQLNVDTQVALSHVKKD